MKIEINLYDETGQQVVGKAIETACQSLIINGQHIISNGGINSEMRELMGQPTAEQIGMNLVPPLGNPDNINSKNIGGIRGHHDPFFMGLYLSGKSDRESGQATGGDAKMGRPVQTPQQTRSR